MNNEMSDFFSAVAKLAEENGLEVKGVENGELILNLHGEFAAMVDESGAMNYHPYEEVLDIMDEIDRIRGNIPIASADEGMQMNM